MGTKFLKSKMNTVGYNKMGFTLVETLVAISILLMAVVAPLGILARDITVVFGVRDKITALYLAEDAVDYVKYKIDTNFNTPQYWLTGLDSCVGGGACQVDSFSDTITSCSGTCSLLNINLSTGVYGYSSGSPSKFTRTVTVQGITPTTNDPYFKTAPQEVEIKATVSWQDHGTTRQTTVSEHAFSWGM